jgi:methylmalonyl-CoA mutase
MADLKVNRLFAPFPVPEKHTWVKVASGELSGKDPLTELQWETQDGLTQLPYYDFSHIPADRSTFQLSPSQSYLGARAWQNMPRVFVRSMKETNTEILNHLVNGADGVLLDISYAKNVSFEKLLNKVELSYCTVALKVKGNQPEAIQSFSSYIKKKASKNSLSGFLLWENIPQNYQKLLQPFKAHEQFKVFGLHTEKKTPVTEIVDISLQGLSILDFLTDRNISAREALTNTMFSMSLTTDFFADIAKIKALRQVWRLLAKAYSVQNFDPYIHAYSDAWLNAGFSPHGNMLKSTTAALAGICGGCNALTILPENEDDTNMNRVARNVSNILREESYLNKVADPTAGSFFIDRLTSDIFHQAWAELQIRIKQ